MEANFFPLFCPIVLLLLLHLVSSHITSFPFIKSLEGVKKGDNIQGIKNLKLYLRKFGYLSDDYLLNNDADVMDYFDDITESSIKTYQINYDLNVTGVLDANTVLMMMQPRCGVSDIFNSTTGMKAGKHFNQQNVEFNYSKSHYAFYPRRPKWPRDKRHLTFGFPRGFSNADKYQIQVAMFSWSLVTLNQIRFKEHSDPMKADIKISFEKGNHGDGDAFDGSEGILAHAFAPTDGRIHFNAAIPWIHGGRTGGYDLKTVALHQLGHVLGLQHSSDPDAIMFPGIPQDTDKEITRDDIRGITTLYDFRK